MSSAEKTTGFLFQEVAVRNAVAALKNSAGSQRFLLADEVGLGKTRIAGGVLSQFVEQYKLSENTKPFTAVYLCSNREIAAQNRSKLRDSVDLPIDESNATEQDRLTLFALEEDRPNDRFRLYTFTPGTSLNLGASTGRKSERELLLRILVKRQMVSFSRTLVDLFRCTCTEWTDEDGRLHWWITEADLGDIQDNPRLSQIAKDVERLWKKQGLIEQLKSLLEKWPSLENLNPVRNKLIGQLRIELARASLLCINPNMIIMDEFQRFPKVLTQSWQKDTLAHQLLAGIPTLLLSATPYKVAMSAAEQNNMYVDFLRTLGFLKGKAAHKDLDALEKHLENYRAALDSGAVQAQALDDESGKVRLLKTCKSKIESILKPVMSRTERSWYLNDPNKGVAEIYDGSPYSRGGVLPTRRELKTLDILRKELATVNISLGEIEDYWQSAPNPLLFMDSGYAAVRRLKGKSGLPVPLKNKFLPDLAPMDAISKKSRHRNLKGAQKHLRELIGENARVAKLAEITTGTKDVVWKYLWLKPSFFYYEDKFFKDAFEPKKVLVFSHWRMVPRALSVLLSQHLLDRVDAHKYKGKVALEANSFSAFEALWASPALANLVNPREMIKKGKLSDAHSFLERAVTRLRRYIQKHQKALGIRILRTGQGSRHRVLSTMARLDACSTDFGETVKKWSPHRNRTAQPYELYKSELRQEGRKPLAITLEDIRYLARIALWSPAISALRAAWSVLPNREECVLPAIEFGLDHLRRFFRNSTAQAMWRHYSGRQRWQKNAAHNLLQYCSDAHFQSLMDEFVWLISETDDRNQAEGKDGLFDHLVRAMDMRPSRQRLNRLEAGEKRGEYYLKSTGAVLSTQFATAFGAQNRSRGHSSEKVTQSVVREAFNSPFWPFALVTTSQGQEGLDFHLYCRDIVHWNLPSNPVDLEQREGRINRFRGLFVRRFISQDYASSDVVIYLERQRKQNGGAPKKLQKFWDAAFDMVSEDLRPALREQRYKHGLFPNWLYERREGESLQPMINRQLIFYAMSRQHARYARLKRSIVFYRMVFGQPKPQDLVTGLGSQMRGVSTQDLDNELRPYMLNLSPIGNSEIDKWNLKISEQMLSDSQKLDAFLMSELKDYWVSHKTQILVAAEKQGVAEVERKNAQLADIAGNCSAELASRKTALSALIYLVNPYDYVFDTLKGIGFDDDVEVIENACKELGIL